MTRLFDEAMWMMRRHDPQIREDGFHKLLPQAATYLDELIREFHAEEDDHGLRCWLLELIGEARSPRALSLLVELLNHDDETLRSLAIRGLELLGTKDARRALWRACNPSSNVRATAPSTPTGSSGGIT